MVPHSLFHITLTSADISPHRMLSNFRYCPNVVIKLSCVYRVYNNVPHPTPRPCHCTPPTLRVPHRRPYLPARPETQPPKTFLWTDNIPVSYDKLHGGVVSAGVPVPGASPMYLSLFFLAFFLSSRSLSSSWMKSISSRTLCLMLMPWDIRT